MDQNVPKWTKMDQNGPKWTEMDQNGPKMNQQYTFIFLNRQKVDKIWITFAQTNLFCGVVSRRHFQLYTICPSLLKV